MISLTLCRHRQALLPAVPNRLHISPISLNAWVIWLRALSSRPPHPCKICLTELLSIRGKLRATNAVAVACN